MKNKILPFMMLIAVMLASYAAADFSVTINNPIPNTNFSILIPVINASTGTVLTNCSYNISDGTNSIQSDFLSTNSISHQDTSIDISSLNEGALTLNVSCVNSSDALDINYTALSLNKDITAPTTSDDYDGLWKNSDFSVTLSPTDNIVGVNHTSFSTDNGASWTNGTTVSISTEGYTNISYYSVDNVGNAETASNITVKLDKTDPTTSDDYDDSWKSTDYTIILSPSDSLSGVNYTNYSIEGGANQTGNSITITTSGNHTIDYYTVDNAGNIETSIRIYALLDKVDPNSSDDYDDLWKTDDYNITISASDNLSGVAYINYTVNGGSMNQVLSSSAKILINTSGNQTVTYFAVDNLGNVEATNTIYALLDKTIPSTSSSAIPNGWVGDTTITLTPSDTISGIAYTNYSVDGGANQTGTSIVLNTDGNHSIEYYSVDAAGNIETVNGPFYVAIDKTAPNSSDDYVLSGWQSSAQTVSISSDDANSGVNRTIINGVSRENITLSTSANHSVSYYAVDNAGNIESTTTIHIAIDVDSPTITRTSPLATNDINQSITVTLSDAHSGVDSTSWAIDFNGTSVSPGNSNATYSSGTLTYTNVGLSEGIYLITLDVDDNAGNSASQLVWNMTVDITDPTITGFVLNDYNVYIGDSIKGSCSATDNLDSSVTTVITGIDTSSTGTRTATCTATDDAGNRVTSTKEYEVIRKRTYSGGGSGSNNPTTPSQSSIISQVGVGILTLEFSKDDVEIKNIEIDALKAASNVRITAKSLLSKPENIMGVTAKKVYKYLEVEHNNLDNEDIGEAKIVFKVPKSWFASNNENPQDILLYRLTDSWDELVTDYLGEEGDSYVFEAASPGMSYFAIGTKDELASDSDQSSQVEPSKNDSDGASPSASNEEDSAADQKEPEALDDTIEIGSGDEKGGSFFGVLVILLIIAIGGAGIYFATKKK